ncbi:hypothetical protein L3X38_024642 [Prunus dulcis]|uniref:Uncharacterized protein n=1 Tax=Prunus dulcis TaxID=3755 RepID=A0AAD4Z6P6_PRUDU|nr:hypothetical protein L3X38_024642 [Prunus dulcis]
MSDKASCSRALDVRALNFEDDNAKDGEKQQEIKSKDIEQQDEMVNSLKFEILSYLELHMRRWVQYLR